MRVFILEDDPARILLLREALFNDDATFITSCNEVSAFKPPYDLILLDHDLGGSQMGYKHGRPLTIAEAEDCGTTFLKLIKDQINEDAVILIHSYNPVGAMNMMVELDDTPCMYMRNPFGGPSFWRTIAGVRDLGGASPIPPPVGA